MRIVTKITSILLIFAFLASTPAVVLGSQGQLLQAEPSKVAMQAIGLAKHYYTQGKFKKAAELFMLGHIKELSSYQKQKICSTVVLRQKELQLL